VHLKKRLVFLIRFRFPNHYLKKVLFFLKHGLIKEKLEEKANALKYYSKSLEFLPYGNDDKYRTLYFCLLQAALFSEIGISTNDLLQYTIPFCTFIESPFR